MAIGNTSLFDRSIRADNQNHLLLTVRSSIPAFSIITVTINSSSCFSLPLSGLSTFQVLQFTIETNATGGAVLPSLLSASPVGSLQESQLFFEGQLIAGGPVRSILAKIVPYMNFRQGDMCVIYFPGFQFWRPIDLNISTLSNWFLYPAVPIASDNSISFSVKENIPSFSEIRISLEAAVDTIIAPTAGIRINDSSFTFTTSANEGPIDQSPFAYVQPIGFIDTELSFFPMRAGQPANLSLSIFPYMPLESGSAISIVLKNFSRLADGKILLETQPPTTVTNALWKDQSSMLIIMLESSVKALSRTVFTILSKSDLCLPNNGIRSNQNDLTISTNDTLGPVLPTAITRVHPVGVLSDVALDISNSEQVTCGLAGMNNGVVYAGRAAGLVIWFRSITEFLVGDSIVVNLPGFTGKSVFITDQRNPSYVSSVQWVLEPSVMCPYGACIVLQVASLVEAGSQICVFVASEYGIVLPVSGVRINDPTLTIETNATLGPVSPTPIAWSRPVGALHETALSYSARLPGKQTAITVQIVAYMNLTVGDTVLLRLVGFNCSYQQGVDLPLSTFTFAARYQLSGGALVLSMRVLQAQEEGSVILFTVLSSARISLPLNDTRANSDSLTIQVFAVEGNVSETAITKSPAISSSGTLEDFVVSFPNPRNPPRAGQTADMLFRFVPTYDLGPGDKVDIYLRGFTGPDVQGWPVSSDPTGVVENVSWSSNFSRVEFAIVGQVEQGEIVSIFLESNERFEILLPSAGILEENSSFLAFLQPAPVGGLRIPGTFIPITIELVGAIQGQPRIEFQPSLAGTASEISLQFSAKMDLNANDVIFVQLPGFNVDSMQKHIAFLNCNISNGTRMQASMLVSSLVSQSTLGITLMTHVPALSSVVILLPLSLGIRLPLSGLPQCNYSNVDCWNNTCVGFTILSTSGNISCKVPLWYTPVATVQRVLLMFGSPVAGQSSSLSLSFELSIPLTIGDSVVLNLPEILGPATSTEELVVSTPYGIVYSCDWYLDTKTLIFYVSNHVAIGTLVTLRVPEHLGLEIPVSGINPQISNISLSVNSVNGILSKYIIGEGLQAVGSFSLCKLNISSDISGVNMILKFSSNMKISAGDSFGLLVDNLISPGGNSTVDVFSTMPGAFESVYWSTESSACAWTGTGSCLLFTVARPILPQEEISVLVPSTSNLGATIINMAGVGYLFTKVQQGPVLNFPCTTDTRSLNPEQNAQSHGGFALSFDAKVAGSSTGFLVQLTPVMILARGDSVLIDFEGFQSPSNVSFSRFHAPVDFLGTQPITESVTAQGSWISVDLDNTNGVPQTTSLSNCVSCNCSFAVYKIVPTTIYRNKSLTAVVVQEKMRSMSENRIEATAQIVDGQCKVLYKNQTYNKNVTEDSYYTNFFTSALPVLQTTATFINVETKYSACLPCRNLTKQIYTEFNRSLYNISIIGCVEGVNNKSSSLSQSAGVQSKLVSRLNLIINCTQNVCVRTNSTLRIRISAAAGLHIPVDGIYQHGPNVTGIVSFANGTLKAPAFSASVSPVIGSLIERRVLLYGTQKHSEYEGIYVKLSAAYQGKSAFVQTNGSGVIFVVDNEVRVSSNLSSASIYYLKATLVNGYDFLQIPPLWEERNGNQFMQAPSVSVVSLCTF